MFRKRRIKKALKKLKDLREYGCFEIPCTECKYLTRVDKYRSTCEREWLMKILMPKYRKQVNEIDALYHKKEGNAMTCKDCISIARCKEVYETFCIHIDLENSGACKHFKNKSDFVEVVRCKDCTEWDKDECECSHWYGFKENAYCCYGERKDVTDTNVGSK